MRLGDGARDGKPETETGALVHGTRVLAAHESFQHGGLLRVRNAGAVVLHLDAQRLTVVGKAHPGVRAVTHGVVDQVGEGASSSLCRTTRVR